MFGALLVSLPVISVISNLTCENFDVFRDNPRNYYLNLLTVCIVHFCNFNQVRIPRPPSPPRRSQIMFSSGLPSSPGAHK